jgi:hypothetical protein
MKNSLTKKTGAKKTKLTQADKTVSKLKEICEK